VFAQQFTLRNPSRVIHRTKCRTREISPAGGAPCSTAFHPTRPAGSPKMTKTRPSRGRAVRSSAPTISRPAAVLFRDACCNCYNKPSAQSPHGVMQIESGRRPPFLPAAH